MNAPSEDVKDMLVAQSALGLTFATDLFIGMEPAKPDACVTIFDSYGYAPDLILDGKTSYERPSIQIRVCDKRYITGMNLAKEIKDVLHGTENETWNGTLYTVIRCTSGPALLDRDENGRFRFIINFNLQRR